MHRSPHTYMDGCSRSWGAKQEVAAVFEIELSKYTGSTVQKYNKQHREHELREGPVRCLYHAVSSRSGCWIAHIGL